MKHLILPFKSLFFITLASLALFSCEKSNKINVGQVDHYTYYNKTGVPIELSIYSQGGKIKKTIENHGSIEDICENIHNRGYDSNKDHINHSDSIMILFKGDIDKVLWDYAYSSNETSPDLSVYYSRNHFTIKENSYRKKDKMALLYHGFNFTEEHYNAAVQITE